MFIPSKPACIPSPSPPLTALNLDPPTMSVRFKESVEQTTGGSGSGRAQFRAQDFKDFGMGKERRHELFHEIGEAVTKGEGSGGYLQVRGCPCLLRFAYTRF